jgi:hypothetical protein
VHRQRDAVAGNSISRRNFQPQPRGGLRRGSDIAPGASATGDGQDQRN